MANDTLTPLKDVVHMQSNEIWDVITLLSVAATRVDNMATDEIDTLRLLYMAGAKLTAVQTALDSYI